MRFGIAAPAVVLEGCVNHVCWLRRDLQRFCPLFRFHIAHHDQFGGDLFIFKPNHAIGENIAGGQREYVFPTQVVRVLGSEVGLKLLPMSTRQHIDFVQCTFARADTWALWQDSFPEDKPLESLMDILKLGFRGYRHLAEFAPPVAKEIFRSLTLLVAWVASFVPRRPEREAVIEHPLSAMAQQ